MDKDKYRAKLIAEAEFPPVCLWDEQYNGQRDERVLSEKSGSVRPSVCSAKHYEKLARFVEIATIYPLVEDVTGLQVCLNKSFPTIVS